MTASQFRSGRAKAGLTQAEAAARLGLSQPYLSQLERGRRRVPERVARAAARLYKLPPTALPVPPKPPEKKAVRDRLPHELAALSYPGYEHLRRSAPVNPASVVLEALSQDDLDARVTEALPWVLARYPELDWDWLLSHAKLRNLQNRLGFLVSVARSLAERGSDFSAAVPRLRKVEQELELARLVADTTLGREAMPAAEKEWLRANRPPEAQRWNVLTNMTAERLPYAA
jgi:transcriptional regulator with XRE-family HTH domain